MDQILTFYAIFFRTESSEQIRGHGTSLYNSVARHLVEATVDPWPNSLIAPAAKETYSLPNNEQKSEDIKNSKVRGKKGLKKTRAPHPKEPHSQDFIDARVTPPESRNQKKKSETNRTLQHQCSSDREVYDKASMAHQQRNARSQRTLKSSEESDITSLDEDSTEYSPLPATKYTENKKQFQRTNSGQSYVSLKQGWMDPDSMLYSEALNDEDLERVSEDSFNRLPDELHQTRGSNPNVVYVPFNRQTGLPIQSDPSPSRPGPDSGPVGTTA